MISRKKLIIALVALVVLAAAGGAYYFFSKDKDAPATAPTAEPQSRSSENEEVDVAAPGPSTPAAGNNACAILTSDIARTVLGGTPEPSAINGQEPRKQNNVTITTCAFNFGSAPQKTASLLMRTADNAEGSANDNDLFGTGRPGNSQSVSGYGDAAYWNGDYRELNILKGTTWYIVTSGSANAPDRTLDEAKKLADLLKNKL